MNNEFKISSHGYAYCVSNDCDIDLNENTTVIRVYFRGRAIDLTLEQIDLLTCFAEFCRQQGKHKNE